VSKRTKLAYIIAGTSISSIIIHNFSFAIFGFEEPVFFLLGIITLPLFFIYVIYQSIFHFRTGKPKDWWKASILTISFISFLGLFLFRNVVKRTTGSPAELDTQESSSQTIQP
jgi:hypothetical protein